MMASERIDVDTLLGDYRVLPKVQERVSFVKEHLPPANEAWAMKASEGAAQVALRNQAVKYQGNLMHLDILQDPPPPCAASARSRLAILSFACFRGSARGPVHTH